MILQKIIIVFLLLYLVLSAKAIKKIKPPGRKPSKSHSERLKLVKKVVTHLGSMTPYRFNANYDLSVDQNSECARKIWMIVGQGSTYPNRGTIKDMDYFLPDLKMHVLMGFAHRKSILPYEVIQKIDAWKSITRDQDQAYASTKAGKNEISALAKRMQSRYPHLLPKKFSNNTYMFKYCDEDSIKDTIRAFTKGLFGKSEMKRAYFPPPGNRDIRIIRSHKDCSKWYDDVWVSREIYDEIDKFFESKFIADAVDNINMELGTNFDADAINLMYTACGFESGCQKEKASPWCYIFNEKNIQPFEYVEDLEQYYRNGYAFEVTGKQACLAVRDAVLFFNDRRNKRKANIYFTDNKSVLHILANLGLYKQKKLNRTSFKWNSRHLWKSSKLAGFGTNLAILYYSCKDGEQLVGVLHNERFVKLPACKETHCDFNVFKKYYNNNINKCEFDKICGKE